MVYWHAKIPNKQNVKHIYAGILSGFLFFIFAMHKKLSAGYHLLLKLAEDKNTGSMRYL